MHSDYTDECNWQRNLQIFQLESCLTHGGFLLCLQSMEWNFQISSEHLPLLFLSNTLVKLLEFPPKNHKLISY